MIHCKRLVVVGLALATGHFGLLSAQENPLAKVKVVRDAIVGGWQTKAGELSVTPGSASRCVIARDVPKNYELSVEFTRTAGGDSVVIILPVGNVSPALEIGGWQEQAHGLSRVDGLPSKHADNPTSIRPAVSRTTKNRP